MTERQLRSHLRSLGNSAKQVAESLEKKGIKGKREDPQCCPLSNFIRTLPDVDDVCIACGSVDVLGPGEHWMGKHLWMRLPKHLHTFYMNFDHNKYPNLVES